VPLSFQRLQQESIQKTHERVSGAGIDSLSWRYCYYLQVVDGP
jgi:hypothetical protein